MARIQFRQAKGKPRGVGYFPQLEGMKRAIDARIEPVTDRGLTGPAARDAEDVQGRVAARAAKLARRAKQAS